MEVHGTIVGLEQMTTVAEATNMSDKDGMHNNQNEETCEARLNFVKNCFSLS